MLKLNMSKNQLIVLILVGVTVALVIFYLFSLPTREGLEGLPVTTNEAGERTEVPVSGSYTPEVPPDVELTLPQSQVPAAPGTEAQLRVFNMTISRDGYNPSQIVVNQGDRVSINITSEGGDYDIEIPDLGLYQNVSAGQSKKIDFQALIPGTFVFECKNMCPGKQINGRLIVK